MSVSQSDTYGLGFTKIALSLTVFLPLVVWCLHKFVYERFVNPRIEEVSETLSQKLVLITGCDSGFGHAFALKFASMGFVVFATCLTASGKSGLESKWKTKCSEEKDLKRLRALRMDVTSQSDCEAVLQSVAAAIGHCTANGTVLHLWALINNAGIMRVGEIDVLQMDDVLQSIDVNVLGAVRMCKLAIPLLRQCADSRIVNICSASVMAPMYAYGVYAMTKSALFSFSTVLRAELSSVWNVHVSCVLPGAFATDLLAFQSLSTFYKKRTEQHLTTYGREYFRQSAERCIAGTKFAAANKLDPVVNAVVDAVMRQVPYHRYIVSWDAWLLYLISFLPLPLRDFFASFVLKPTIAPLLVRNSTKSQSCELSEFPTKKES